MEIYKVPKVLIFHLKRFKNSNKFFKSKLETLIEFPIEEFDIREYVLNHHLPEEFELENAGEACIIIVLILLKNRKSQFYMICTLFPITLED